MYVGACVREGINVQVGGRGVRVCVMVGVGDGPSVLVGVRVGVAVRVGVGEGVNVGVRVGVGVDVSEGTGVGVAEGGGVGGCPSTVNIPDTNQSNPTKICTS